MKSSFWEWSPSTSVASRTPQVFLICNQYGKPLFGLSKFHHLLLGGRREAGSNSGFCGQERGGWRWTQGRSLMTAVPASPVSGTQKIRYTGQESIHRKEKGLEGKLMEGKTIAVTRECLPGRTAQHWGGPSIYPELLRDLTLHTASHSSLAHPLQGTEFLLLHPWYPSNPAQKLMGPGGWEGPAEATGQQP